MAFNLMLAPFFGYVGLAIATTMSATLNAFMLYRGLKQLGVYTMSPEAKAAIVKLVISAMVMAGVVWTMSPSFEQWLSFSFFESVWRLTWYICAGVISFFAFAFLSGIRPNDLKVKTVIKP